MDKSENPLDIAKEPGAAPDAAHRLLLPLREPSPDGPRFPALRTN